MKTQVDEDTETEKWMCIGSRLPSIAPRTEHNFLPYLSSSWASAGACMHRSGSASFAIVVLLWRLGSGADSEGTSCSSDIDATSLIQVGNAVEVRSHRSDRHVNEHNEDHQDLDEMHRTDFDPMGAMKDMKASIVNKVKKAKKALGLSHDEDEANKKKLQDDAEQLKKVSQMLKDHVSAIKAKEGEKAEEEAKAEKTLAEAAADQAKVADDKAAEEKSEKKEAD